MELESKGYINNSFLKTFQELEGTLEMAYTQELDKAEIKTELYYLLPV